MNSQEMKEAMIIFIIILAGCLVIFFSLYFLPGCLPNDSLKTRIIATHPSPPVEELNKCELKAYLVEVLK